MKLGLNFKNQGTNKSKKGLFFLSEAPINKSLFCFVFYTGCFLILAKDCFNSFGKIGQEILNTLYKAMLSLNKIFLLTRHFILGDLRVEWTRVEIVDHYMHRILEAWQSTQAESILIIKKLLKNRFSDRNHFFEENRRNARPLITSLVAGKNWQNKFLRTLVHVQMQQIWRNA